MDESLENIESLEQGSVSQSESLDAVELSNAEETVQDDFGDESSDLASIFSGFATENIPMEESQTDGMDSFETIVHEQDPIRVPYSVPPPEQTTITNEVFHTIEDNVIEQINSVERQIIENTVHTEVLMELPELEEAPPEEIPVEEIPPEVIEPEPEIISTEVPSDEPSAETPVITPAELPADEPVDVVAQEQPETIELPTEMPQMDVVSVPEPVETPQREIPARTPEAPSTQAAATPQPQQTQTAQNTETLRTSGQPMDRETLKARIKDAFDSIEMPETSESDLSAAILAGVRSIYD